MKKLRPLQHGFMRAALVTAGALACSLALAEPALRITTAQGAERTSAPAWQAPPNAQLPFTVQGKAKGFQFHANAQLHWQVDGTQYEAVQEVQLPLVGSRRQSSVGTISAAGVQPQVFIDRSRKEYRVSFDAASGQVLFSRGSPTAVWQAQLQDRVSVFFQLAGMVAAAPQDYPKGTRIRVLAASNKSVKPWVFVVDRQETLQLPAGSMPALKLWHLDADEADRGEAGHSALWLAPRLGYLPVRIRMQESERDMLDLQLQTVPQELVKTLRP